jgi:hypothetical protein
MAWAEADFPLCRGVMQAAKGYDATRAYTHEHTAGERRDAPRMLAPPGLPWRKVERPRQARAERLTVPAAWRNRPVASRHEDHDGEPKPDPPPDPNLKSWSVHLIGGKKMQLLGSIEAVSEAAAIERVVVLFARDDERRNRLEVNLRR